MSQKKEVSTKKAEDPREYYRQAKLYDLFGALFALAGLAIFLVLYVRNIEGRLFEAIANPATLLMIVIPFLPAVILTNKSKSLKNKALQLLSKKQ